jgi:serine/threonine protein kinase
MTFGRFLRGILGVHNSNGWGEHPRKAHPNEAAVALRSYPGAVYKKGDFIGRAYEVYGVLGMGGFSIVYLVYANETETAFALKTLKDEFLQDAETRDQFRKEAKVWVDLERHPNIVAAHFIEELAGRLYIGMEYISPDDEGLNSLEGYLKYKPPDLIQSLRWAIQFCLGMEHAHAKGIRCHRDVKPANIMITPDLTVKITDFGFADVIDISRARAVSDPLYRRRRMLHTYTGFGTPTYMPPEQFQNASRCDERSDIYSFGIVLYQMASQGRLPFLPAGREGLRDQASVWQEMHRLHTSAPIPPLASPLFPVIQRCMQKEPNSRYQTFGEVRRELEPLLQRLAGEVPKPQKTAQLKAWELYNKAFSLSSLGHLQEAIACYDRCLALEPKNSDALNNKGNCLRRLGRIPDALSCYEKAIQANRNNASAWGNKGNALHALGKSTEAIACLNKAIDIDPLNESAWLNKGIVEERLGLSAEAATSYQRFVDLKPVEYAAHLEYARSRLLALKGAIPAGRKPK